MKKKSKRWIKELAVQNKYLIHLFDFFFISSGYQSAGYYCQAFVFFVSLWFKIVVLTIGLALFLCSTVVGQSRRSNKPGDNYIPIELAQRFGLQQVGETSAERVRPAVRNLSSGPEALVKKAEQLVRAGKIERAIELYQKAIESKPQLFSAYLGLGDAFTQLGNFSEAKKIYQKAIPHVPNSAEAELSLGVALYYSGDIAEAITQYERAIASSKRFPAAHFNLAMACAHQGDFRKAIEHYRIAIDQRGNIYPEAYNNLGLVYEAMGDLEIAVAQFRLAIEQRGGRYSLARYNLARFYELQKDYNRAIAELQFAIGYQANFPEAYLNLANLYLTRTILMETNELEKVIVAYRRAIALRNNFYPLAHENLAIALSIKGRKEEALTEYRIAFDQYKGQCPDALRNLIATMSNKESSFSFGNELSRTDNPGNLTSKMKGVQASKSLAEDIRRALSEYSELDEELKGLPDIHYCAGLSFTAVSDWNRAIDEFARAIELSKNGDPDAKRALISILELILYL